MQIGFKRPVMKGGKLLQARSVRAPQRLLVKPEVIQQMCLRIVTLESPVEGLKAMLNPKNIGNGDNRH